VAAFAGQRPATSIYVVENRSIEISVRVQTEDLFQAKWVEPVRRVGTIFRLTAGQRGIIMRKLLITIILLVTFPALVHPGFFGGSVDLDDLAQLSQKGLGDLKDSEFEVFLAQVRLAGAKDDLKKANGELKAVKKILSSEKSDLKATEFRIKSNLPGPRVHCKSHKKLILRPS
jgi:hypothetical protein